MDTYKLARQINKRHPKDMQLTLIRLARLLYLTDWRSALVRGKQISDIVWVKDSVFMQEMMLARRLRKYKDAVIEGKNVAFTKPE